MDNPDKYQDDEKEIEVYNGFDISNVIAFTKEEKYCWHIKAFETCYIENI